MNEVISAMAIAQENHLAREDKLAWALSQS